ncbi:hypothetical protein [Escherichia coli]|uniref:hypothetical protein n=1 Tax=Escherichia coli TaxID=562 RepID=UPI00248BA9BE|nr:hypothetical protein [Escherichia coli]
MHTGTTKRWRKNPGISTGGYRHPEMHHIRLINGSHFCATNMEEVRVLTATRNTGGKAWQ